MCRLLGGEGTARKVLESCKVCQKPVVGQFDFRQAKRNSERVREADGGIKPGVSAANPGKRSKGTPEPASGRLPVGQMYRRIRVVYRVGVTQNFGKSRRPLGGLTLLWGTSTRNNLPSLTVGLLTKKEAAKVAAPHESI